MTIEEYLTDVKRIYYQLSVIVEGKQLLADGNALFLVGKAERLADLRDGKHRLRKVRFASLSIPAAAEVDQIGSDHAVINCGGVHLTIWPKEVTDAPSL